MKKHLAALLAVVVMAGCATVEPRDETRNWTVGQIYAEARDELNSGNYQRAQKLYETLQARFPYGRHAQQALMDQAYAHYKDSEPELAIATANRFARLYPAHPNLDYIYYLKGLVYFNDDDTFFSRLSGQDMSERDSKAARESYAAFGELVSRFPESKYAEDASAKMAKLVIALGANEMHVARYYMKRGAWLAAVNRAQVVIKEYGNTGFNEEALALSVAAYEQLGKKDLAESSRRVLQLNFPQSRYLKQQWEPKSLPWWKFWS